MRLACKIKTSTQIKNKIKIQISLFLSFFFLPNKHALNIERGLQESSNSPIQSKISHKSDKKTSSKIKAKSKTQAKTRLGIQKQRVSGPY